MLPTDPGWAPDEPARRRALGVLQELAPKADDVSAEVHDAIVFVDAGENGERIDCPACASPLTEEWWQTEMERAHQEQFRRLAVRTPCCDTGTSLNDLHYIWPAGFARTVLTARGPGRGWLTAGERDRVGAALGHPLREVRSRY